MFWKVKYNLQDVRVFPGPLIRAKATSLICTGTATTQKIWQLAANFEETSVSFKVSAIITIHNICVCAQVCKDHYISTCVCYKCIKKAKVSFCTTTTLLPPHLASIISSNLFWYLFPRTYNVV